MSVAQRVRELINKFSYHENGGTQVAQEFHEAAQRVAAQSENLKRTIEETGDDPLGVFAKKVQGRRKRGASR